MLVSRALVAVCASAFKSEGMEAGCGSPDKLLPRSEKAMSRSRLTCERLCSACIDAIAVCDAFVEDASRRSSAGLIVREDERSLGMAWFNGSDAGKQDSAWIP